MQFLVKYIFMLFINFLPDLEIKILNYQIYILLLTHFWPVFQFYTPWKHQKTKRFPLFTGVKWEYCSEMGQDYWGNNFYIKKFIFSILRCFQDKIFGNFVAEIIEPGKEDQDPSCICLLKVNSRTRCEICSKLTTKTPERRNWRGSVVFIVNLEYISHLVLVLAGM